MKTIKEIRVALANPGANYMNSAWKRGVNVYAQEIIADLPDDMELCGSPTDKKTLLNGADNWTQYGYGGCSLICDCDIAERLCTPSELRRCKGGDLRPNNREEWHDVQARALFQAARHVLSIARR